MNVLKQHKKLVVLSALLEGCSVRSTERMTGVTKRAILRLLVQVGDQCQQIHYETMRGIQCQAIECDEIWGFIGKKQRLTTPDDRVSNPKLGGAYTFVALDPDSKAVISFTLGKRDNQTTWKFIRDLRERVVGNPQISTDGFHPYIEVVNSAFGRNAHFAQVIKRFAFQNPGPGRYSPPKVVGVAIHTISGNPHRSKICTSYVERNNLNLRMNVRRLTRLTNAFSRKWENLKAALSLWFWYYNFVRIHTSTRVTPAMAAGVTNRVWELEEIIA